MALDWSARFHATVEIEAHTDSGATRWRDIVDSLERPGCFNVLQIDALGGNGLLAIERQLLFGVLERLFGGGAAPPPESSALARTRLSRVEERIVRRIVLGFGRALEAAWRPVEPLTTRHLRVEQKAENAAVAQPGDWVMSTTYDFVIDDQPAGSCTFVLPLALLEPLKERLSTGNYEEKRDDDEGWAPFLREALPKIPVPVIAELGRANITLGQLLDLSIGDVLRLDQPVERPIRVTVDGTAKYLGDVSVKYGNLAVQLRSLYGAQGASEEQ
jgi:flagellar motor switch protein FliM